MTYHEKTTNLSDYTVMIMLLHLREECGAVLGIVFTAVAKIRR